MDLLGILTAVSRPVERLYRGRVADQIVADLRRQILVGDLADGARLPSERELAAQYDVSAPTVREAVRVLTAMGLLNTRNGSRTTVTANADALLRMSIASVVQFENMPAGSVLGLLGALNAYAVELAVDKASDEDIARLREAAERTADMTDSASGGAALCEFFTTLSAISHNPLLAAVSKAITEIQIGMALELSGGARGGLGRVAGPMYQSRIDIVDAIARRDAATAADRVREYHDRVIERIGALPRAKHLAKSDPGLSAFMSSWLSTNVSVGSSPVAQGDS
jgi:DNA-binding FadR family transcriptional regulator